VLRNLQVLAESSQRLSDGLKLSQPNVPGKQIEGFRHWLVHDYFRIDLELIWRVVNTFQNFELPPAACQKDCRSNAKSGAPWRGIQRYGPQSSGPRNLQQA